MKAEVRTNNSFLETIKLQQKACNPNYSVFVSASAGSGKTTILTNRVLRLLLNGVLPSKILCLTFTKVGAAEMQNRIYQELSNWVTLPEDDLIKKLTDLTSHKPSDQQITKTRSLFATILDDDEGLNISTIHSFCQNLIKKFPIESGINPNFQIIDKTIENDLLNQAKTELLDLALNDQNLAKLITNLAVKLNEQSFLEVLLEMIHKRDHLEVLKEKYHNIDNVIKAIYSLLNCDIDDNEDKVTQLICNPNLDSKGLNLLSELMEEFGTANNKINAGKIRNYLNKPTEENFNHYQNVFLTTKNEARAKVAVKKVMEPDPAIVDIITIEQYRLDKIINYRSSINIANSTKNLLLITEKMLEIYSNLKNKHNYVDYNDLISKTSTLLQNSENADWVKFKLDGLFEHILIDESQDTNHYQWNIVKAITDDFFSGDNAVNKNRTIFVVGDEKQSIFSFQGANPHIFGDILDYYQEKSVGKIEKIPLSNSFRSLPAILQTVDLVFSQEPYQNYISKLENVKHSAIRTTHPGKVELWPIISVEKEKNKEKSFIWPLNFENNEEIKAQELLAENIANYIHNWFQNGKTIIDRDGISRPIKYRDIMILLKNRTNKLGHFLIKHLQKLEIPVSGNDKIKLLENIIIQDLLAAGKFVLLPEDDLNLACLLKSPLLNISEEKLQKLCIAKNKLKISLFAAVKSSDQKTYDYLKNLINQHHKNPHSLYLLFNYILELQNGQKQIATRFGKESSEIINQFLLTCLQFEQNHHGNLENFINAMNKGGFEISIDSDNQENDAINIATIHSSKGLESPIVFLADAAHNSKGKSGGNYDRIIWSGEKYSHLPFLAIGNNKLLTQINNDNRNSGEEEYWRLLYVAMTRAANELYVTGFGNQIIDECWYNVIKKAISGKAKDRHSLLIIGEDNSAKKSEQPDEINKKNEELSTLPNFVNQIPDSEYDYGKSYAATAAKIKLNDNSALQDNLNFGQIIHKILELLPQINHNDNRRNIADNFLKTNYQLNQKQQSEIIDQVFSIIENDKFSKFFGANSYSEVPVIGEIDGKIISGKIDRLIFDDNEITIIDYKTGTRITDQTSSVFISYKKQLLLYKELITKIYPDKNIKCAILWTLHPQIDYIRFC